MNDKRPESTGGAVRLRPMRVKASAARRIASGSLWVYANEALDRLSDFADGEPVELVAPGGAPLGIGAVEPRSLIAVRVFVRAGSGGLHDREPTGRGESPAIDRESPAIDRALFLRRVRVAEARRAPFLRDSSYRLIFSESDLLPGIIIDRYHELFVVQLLTWGAERLKPVVVDGLRELYRPRGILVRNDVEQRLGQGLSTEDEVLLDDPTVDLRRYPVTLAGLTLEVDFHDAQKTGLFLDQVPSYHFVDGMSCAGMRGGDLFCYSGLFGMLALARGAEHITFVDSSETALQALERNLAASGIPGDRWRLLREDVLTWLPTVEPASFDLLFVDPPKFIKSRKTYYQGLQGYFNLNRAATAALADGGLLFTYSCSHHAGEEIFRSKVLDAVRKAGASAYELARFRQNVDHPVHLAMPESFYLSGLLLRIDREQAERL